MESSIASKPASKPEKRSRSARLRKYGQVYKKYFGTKEEKKERKEKNETKFKDKDNPKPKVKPKDTNKNKTKPKDKDEPKDTNKVKPNDQHKKTQSKPLNSYQDFVKKESQKPKYKDMPGSQRMAKIAKEWKRYGKR